MNVVFFDNMWVALKCASVWCWDEDADLEMDRHLLQMHVVAIMGSCAGSQALGKVCHRLVDVGFVAALPIWSATHLSTHQSSCVLAGVYDTFPACHHRRDSPVGSNLESLRPLILFYQSHPHVTRENNVPNHQKLQFTFFQGSPAALCRWGGQISNFCVVYYPNIHCVK